MVDEADVVSTFLETRRVFMREKDASMDRHGVFYRSLKTRLIRDKALGEPAAAIADSVELAAIKWRPSEASRLRI